MSKNLYQEVIDRKFRYSVFAIIHVTSLLSALFAYKKNAKPIDIVELFPEECLREHGHLWSVLLERFDIKKWKDIEDIIYFMVEIGELRESPEDDRTVFAERDKVSSFWLDCQKLEVEGFLTREIERSIKSKYERKADSSDSYL